MVDAIRVAAPNVSEHTVVDCDKEDLKDLSRRENSNEGVGNNIDQETCNIMMLSLRNMTLNRS